MSRSSRTVAVYVESEVDVSLADIDTDDLVEELHDRQGVQVLCSVPRGAAAHGHVSAEDAWLALRQPGANVPDAVVRFVCNAAGRICP